MITPRDQVTVRRRSDRARQRRIGRWGTVARLLLGVFLLGDVAIGHWTRGFHPAAWALGLVGFPAILLGAQWLRARHARPALRATGPAGHAVNAAIYLTPTYAPALSITSDAALIFYGTSMLIAAARGYAGCEVLALSNWLLRRDDQIGCLLFAPIDHLEQPAHTENRRQQQRVASPE